MEGTTNFPPTNHPVAVWALQSRSYEHSTQWPLHVLFPAKGRLRLPLHSQSTSTTNKALKKEIKFQDVEWLYPFQDRRLAGWKDENFFGFDCGGILEGLERKEEGGGVNLWAKTNFDVLLWSSFKVAIGKVGLEVCRGVLQLIWDTPQAGEAILLFEFQQYSQPKKNPPKIARQGRSTPTTWNYDLKIAVPPSSPPLFDSNEWPPSAFYLFSAYEGSLSFGLGSWG